MPTYRITGPDGATYEVTAPEGASEQDVMAYVQSQQQPALPATPPHNPTQDMGTTERTLAGIGQGMTSAVNSIEQLMANVPMLAGPMAGAIPPGMAELTNRRADENARLDAPLMDTTAGSVGGMIGETAITLPAGIGGKAVQGAGALAKMANAARMGLQGGAFAGAAQPVLEASGPDGFLGQKAQQIGTGAAVGGATGGILNRAGALLENLVPSNAMATVTNFMGGKANKGQLAREGEEIAARTGIDLTPAQVNADPSMTMAENMARQSIFSRSMVAEGDKKRVGQLVEHLDRTLSGISKSGASPEIAGEQVQNAARNVLKKIEDTRSKVAGEDFGRVEKLVNGAPVIKAKTFDQTLASLIDENSVAPKGSGQRAIADALTSLRASVTREPKAPQPSKILGPNGQPAMVVPGESGPQLTNLRISDMLKTRRYLSQVSGGAATLAGATDKPMQKRAAAMLLQALDDDIENSAGAIGGQIGQALKGANGNYRAFSQQLESVEKSPLRTVLGEEMAGAVESGTFNTVAPEKVMAKLSGMTPTELGVVRGLLQKDNPEAWATFKRGYLESAIEKAKEMPASAGVNTPVMRPTNFVKNVGDQKKLEAIYTPEEVAEINAAVNAARRMGDSTGYNFSGTAPAQEALGLMNRVTSAGLKGISEVGSMALGSRKLARLMNDNKGRAALLELSRLPPQSKRARELAAQIAAMTAADEGGEP